MTAVADLSNRLVADWAALSPITATFIGVPGFEAQLDDLSPTGLAALDDLFATALRAASTVDTSGPADESARRGLMERLEVERDRYASGWAHASLNVIESPVQMVRLVFDVMPTTTERDWSTYAARLRAVPAAVAGYRESLQLAASRGQVAAVRQVDGCVRQCDAYAGVDGEPGFFTAAVGGAAVDEQLAAELTAAAFIAESAYAELGQFLRTELRPLAPTRDAVGKGVTGSSPDCSSARPWTCTTPTTGVGGSSWRSRRSCAKSPTASFRVAPRKRWRTRSTPTRPTG